MARANLIKIGSTYLTEDGTETALRYLSDVAGLHLLPNALANIGPVIKAASGKPRKFGLENLGEGVDIKIKLNQLTTDIRDAVAAELDIAPTATVNMTIDGPSGSYDLDVKPGEMAITWGPKTRAGRVYDVEINVVVDSVN